MRIVHCLCLCAGLMLLDSSAVAAAATGTDTDLDQHPPLRVLTYNVLHHTDTFIDDLKWLFAGTPRPSARIAPTLDLLAGQNADVIALQEVTPVLLGAIAGDTRWQAYQVASSLPPVARGWRHQLTIAARYLFGLQPWGQVILSKWPLSGVRTYPMGRPLLVADVTVDDLTLTVATCHLDSFPEQRQTRIRQLREIFGRIGAARHALLLGDFNFGDDAPEQAALPRAFTDIWRALNPDDPGYTFPSDANQATETMTASTDTRERLDRILLRSDRLTPIGVERIGDQPVSQGDTRLYLSDHNGVVAELRY